MSGYLVSDNRKVTTHRFIEMKERGEKISMLTSYDFTTAGIVDGAGIDGILIGDSASNVMVGNSTTLPITIDQMIYHASAVARAVKRALVVCDMPFGSYQVDRKEGVKNAIKIMKESGCDALKLEGGVEIIDTVKGILDAGIPVMAHLGLTPQSINSVLMPCVQKRRLRLRNSLLTLCCSRKQDASLWYSRRCRQVLPQR